MKRPVLLAAARAVCALAILLAATACTSGTAEPSPSTSTMTSTVTGTRSAPQPLLQAYVPILRPDDKPPAGQVDRFCPYIATGIEQQQTSAPNVADIIGIRLYRTTVITGTKPVGCRFFYHSSVAGEGLASYYAAADIVPTAFATSAEAVNALRATALASDPNARAQSGIAPGADGTVFRAKFYQGDKGRDWTCAFVKGTTVVVVRTARTDDPNEAVSLAQAVAQKI